MVVRNPNGNPTWTKGRTMPDEIKEKIRAKAIGRIPSDEARVKMSQSRMGNQNAKGCHPSQEQKDNLSRKFKGKVFSEETRRKISENRKGKGQGASAGGWKGGKSFEPYTPEFTRQLKRLIRDRDGHKCQMCGTPESEIIKQLSVHHIDYDKRNCLPNNLICLCNICHQLTTNRREYWAVHFRQQLAEGGNLT